MELLNARWHNTALAVAPQSGEPVAFCRAHDQAREAAVAGRCKAVLVLHRTPARTLAEQVIVGVAIGTHFVPWILFRRWTLVAHSLTLADTVRTVAIRALWEVIDAGAIIAIPNLGNTDWSGQEQSNCGEVNETGHRAPPAHPSG